MLHQKFMGLIKASGLGDERSAQKQIGPSGLGQDCFHCLGAAIAEVPKYETDEYLWSQVKGRHMHEYMQGLLEEANRAANDKLYLTERKVTVGTIGPKTITGTMDCYDVEEQVVIDWKFPGAGTLAKVAKRNISAEYQEQPHLYGLGMENEGFKVKGTLVLFLPMASPKLSDAIPYFQPYDRARAEAVMAKANRIWELLQRDGVEECLSRLKRKAGCNDCPRYSL